MRNAIDRGCTVLGICLGAQMIAPACGMQVYPKERELGWRTIHGCAPGMDHLFPGSFPVFHWHTETFDLPEGAELLATGSAVPNQAFLLGHALGVQFHPEVTAPVIAQWAKDLGDAERLDACQGDKREDGRKPGDLVRDSWTPSALAGRLTREVWMAISNVKGFLIDIDGVLSTGDTAIPGAREAHRVSQGTGLPVPVRLQLDP